LVITAIPLGSDARSTAYERSSSAQHSDVTRAVIPPS